MSSKNKYWSNNWAFEKEPKIEHQPCLSLQEVVDMSNFYLKIYSAILYGLLTGPEVNADKCMHYIELGKKYSITPNENYFPPDFNSTYAEASADTKWTKTEK